MNLTNGQFHHSFLSKMIAWQKYSASQAIWEALSAISALEKFSWIVISVLKCELSMINPLANCFLNTETQFRLRYLDHIQVWAMWSLKICYSRFPKNWHMICDSRHANACSKPPLPLWAWLICDKQADNDLSAIQYVKIQLFPPHSMQLPKMEATPFVETRRTELIKFGWIGCSNVVLKAIFKAFSSSFWKMFWSPVYFVQ